MENGLLLNLRKFLVPEIVYGNGALRLAGRHALNLGATKVLLVADPGVNKSGWTAKVQSGLEQASLDYVTFSSVSPNPKDHEVMKGAEMYLQEGCDLIIAVGGGSPMDCAKGIGVVATNSGSIVDFEGVDEIVNPVPPLIFIPTTAGTSADVSQFAIITDTQRDVKIAIISKMVIPDIALVDPETTMSMSPELTAATGMDALCHAFEAYVSTVSSPLTDMAALTAVRYIAENLPGAYREPDNAVYRDKMMMASLMAGIAFSNASLGIVHAMAHSLGGLLDFPHGECNALLLEHAIPYNYIAARHKYNKLGEAMGIPADRLKPDEAGRIIGRKIGRFREELGISGTLKEMGATLDDLPLLAQHAVLDPCLATNPREASSEDIQEIYHKIYG